MGLRPSETMFSKLNSPLPSPLPARRGEGVRSPQFVCVSLGALEGQAHQNPSRRDALKIARRFNAGNGALDEHQVPKGRLTSGLAQSSLRNSLFCSLPNPTLKRRAILAGPSGTTESTGRSHRI